MTFIDRSELVNLDVTIAEFIIPRLIAFRGADKTYPADLDSVDEWRAELTRMIRAWTDVSIAPDHGVDEYAKSTRAGLKLFAKRLGHLWL